MERNICGGKLRPKINTEDDAYMVASGLRNSSLDINRRTFKKNLQEKKDLKKVRNNYTPKDLIVKSNGFKDVSPIGNLVVHLENIEKRNDFKTTLSYKSIRRSLVDNIIFRLSERKLRVKDYKFSV